MFESTANLKRRKARFCSAILLLLPSTERLVSVGGGLTMEELPLISASIVAADIINVHV